MMRKAKRRTTCSSLYSHAMWPAGMAHTTDCPQLRNLAFTVIPTLWDSKTYKNTGRVCPYRKRFDCSGASIYEPIMLFRSVHPDIDFDDGIHENEFLRYPLVPTSYLSPNNIIRTSPVQHRDCLCMLARYLEV